jgi:hypothetical protein
MTTNQISLTTDPFELELLEEDMLDVVEPGDPYYREITQIGMKISALRARMPPKHVKIMNALMAAQPKIEIIKELKTSYVTIKKVMLSKNVQEMLACQYRSARLRKGPSMAARAALLWRIATDNEHINPRVSIAAVDTLNRQEGVYQKDEDKAKDTIVNILQFSITEAKAHQITTQDSNEREVNPSYRPITITQD